jgi:hypothetical protein
MPEALFAPLAVLVCPSAIRAQTRGALWSITRRTNLASFERLARMTNEEPPTINSPLFPALMSPGGIDSL